MILLFIMLAVAIMSAISIIVIENYFMDERDSYIDIRYTLSVVGALSMIYTILGYILL